MLFLTACEYGPERTALTLKSVAAKPHSHVMAVSLEYARLRDPSGLINTFPNGGSPKVIHLEARVYSLDLDRGTTELVATIQDYAGIPHPKSVFVKGWQSDTLYFSLFGYGGNARTGDDHSDERRLYYRVSADGTVNRTDDLPADLEHEPNNGPLDSPPFLRWSKGHLEVEIAMDTRVSEATEIVLLTFDPESGEPRLSIQ
jgi:hypothetical protein